MRSGRPLSREVGGALEMAALALFAEGGLASASFDQVARRAGVSRAALYRRWSTRETLIASALQAFRMKAEAGLEDWADRPLAEVLDLFVEQAAATFSDPFACGLMRQLSALGPEGAEIKLTYWSTIVEPRRQAFNAMIVDAQSRGQIDPQLSPDLMQDLLAGALSYRMLTHPPDSEFDFRAYINSVLKAVGFPR